MRSLMNAQFTPDTPSTVEEECVGGSCPISILKCMSCGTNMKHTNTRIEVRKKDMQYETVMHFCSDRCISRHYTR